MEFNTFLTTLALPDPVPTVDPASLFAVITQLSDPASAAAAVILSRLCSS